MPKQKMAAVQVALPVDGWFISPDVSSYKMFRLQEVKSGARAGEVTEVTVGYYATVTQCLEALAQEMSWDGLEGDTDIAKLLKAHTDALVALKAAYPKLGLKVLASMEERDRCVKAFAALEEE